MSQLITSRGIFSQGVKLGSFAGDGQYPNLTASDAGFMLFDSTLGTLVFWDGASWYQVRKQGKADGSTPSNAIEDFTEWYSGGVSAGEYWVKPNGYGGNAELVAIDVDGSAQFSPINDSGVWVRVRYSQSFYSRTSPWSGRTGLSDPSNQSTTAYSGDFSWEQSDGFINSVLNVSTEVRQTFESWGYGSVGWTYQGNNAYMEGKGFDGVNYTRWGGNGGTHTGVTGGRLNGMSHSVTSINGPWDNPTANGTDACDANDSVWRYGRFHFRWTGGTSKQPLPIKGVYNADVDDGSEQRYFPFRDAAGGWSGLGESNIYIKVV